MKGYLIKHFRVKRGEEEEEEEEEEEREDLD